MQRFNFFIPQNFHSFLFKQRVFKVSRRYDCCRYVVLSRRYLAPTNTIFGFICAILPKPHLDKVVLIPLHTSSAVIVCQYTLVTKNAHTVVQIETETRQMSPADADCERLVAEYDTVEFLLRYLSTEGQKEQEGSDCSEQSYSTWFSLNCHDTQCNGESHHVTQHAYDDNPPQRHPFEVEYTERFLAADLLRRVQSAQITAPPLSHGEASIYPRWLSWGRGHITNVKVCMTEGNDESSKTDSSPKRRLAKVLLSKMKKGLTTRANISGLCSSTRSLEPGIRSDLKSKNESVREHT